MSSSPISRCTPESDLRNGSWFGRERSFWQFCTGIFCAFAVLKGVSAPNDWAYTQALLDYSHGFIKRALRGEMLALLHIHSLTGLTIVFFAELAALLLLLAELARRSGVQQRFGSLAPVAVFASSYALTYFTFIVGYADVPLMACTVALLLLRSPRLRFTVALLVVPACLLVHENFLLMNLPVLLFSFVADAFATSAASVRRRILAQGAALAVLAVAVTLFIALRPKFTPMESLQFQHDLALRAGFTLHAEVFHVLARPLGDSVRESLWGMTQRAWILPGLATFANLLPPTLFLLYLVRRLLQRQTGPGDWLARWMWPAALAATLTPLLMYVLGFDFGRWNTGSATSAFLVFTALNRSILPSEMKLSPAERNVAVFLLAFNMATGFGLFGDYLTHPFPFFPALSENLR